MATQLPPVPQITKDGFADPVWPKWLNLLRSKVIASVVSLAIRTANGFSGSVVVDGAGVANVTLEVTVAGLLKGSGGALVAAIPGTDFVSSISVTAPIENIGSAASPNIAHMSSGVIAGTYTKVSVNLLGHVTSGADISSTDIATALGYTPAHAGANSDITSITGLTTPLAVNQGGTGVATLTNHAVVIGKGTAAVAGAAPGTAGQMLISAGATNDPVFGNNPVITGGTVDGAVIGGATPEAGGFTTLSANVSMTAPIYESFSSGTTAPSGVPVTVFTIPNGIPACYLIHVSQGTSNDTVHFSAFAVVLSDGTSARLAVVNNGTLQTITLLGLAVQSTQSSGVSVTISAGITRIA